MYLSCLVYCYFQNKSIIISDSIHASQLETHDKISKRKKIKASDAGDSKSVPVASADK